MFSDRLPRDLAPNRLAQRRRGPARARADPIIDLTESNPTRAGFDYPADLLAPLADPRGAALRADAVRTARGATRPWPPTTRGRASTCRPSASC